MDIKITSELANMQVGRNGRLYSQKSLLDLGYWESSSVTTRKPSLVGFPPWDNVWKLRMEFF